MNPIWLLLFLAIVAPALCGLLSLALPRRVLCGRVVLTLLGPAITIALLGWCIHLAGVDGEVVSVAWLPTLNMNLAFHADKLGLFFALLVSSIGFLVILYARAYFGPDPYNLYRFYPSLLLFMTAMLGVALSDNFMLLLVFWELTSISSFLLIGWDRGDPEAVRKAMQAFIVTAAGGLSLMGGLILMGIHTGQWSFSGLLAIRDTIQGGPVLTASFILIFGGAAAKSAQWPLHFWLPGAMAAPTPVSAYLHSATMVKAGIYLIGRLWPIFAGLGALPLWPSLIIPLGAVTMVYAAFVALQKHDLKQMFAYTTVSQLGLLMAMYGLSAYNFEGHPNLIWDITQILNHAFYKAPLFILAGAIGHIASRDITELKGFFHRGRTPAIMSAVLLLAAYALAAGPLTISFSAKEFFFYQIYHALEVTGQPIFWLLIVAGVLTGMFNVAIFLRLARVLLARPEGNPYQNIAHGSTDDTNHDPLAAVHTSHAQHAAHEHGWWPAFLWIPGAVFVALQFIGGSVPFAYDKMFGWLERSAHNYPLHTLLGQAFPLVWDVHLGFPLYMSVAAIALGIALAFSPLLGGVWNDPSDNTYNLFFRLVCNGGGRLFRSIQTGHLSTYIAITTLAIVALFIWAITGNTQAMAWPTGKLLEPFNELMLGYLLTVMVCLTAILMPLVRQFASRVLVLGATGFSVTAVYYFYQAPDLALTQISIEIVSIILFLLVLSMLPAERNPNNHHSPGRLIIALLFGGVMFWLTLSSSTGTRVALPYHGADGSPITSLGQYFLRNSYHGLDSIAVTPHTADQSGLVDRGVAHRIGFGSDYLPEPSDTTTVTLHKGAGGHNVVNVILVDFRGFDTMGEITVLSIAALGVWTLLRKRRDELPELIPSEQGDKA